MTSTPTTFRSKDHTTRPSLADLRLDKFDLHYYIAFKWKVVRRHHRFYVQARGSGEYLHRLVASARPGDRVTFIDGDTLNLRRSNLRLATHAEVAAQRRGPAPSSGYRGVQRNGYWWRAVASKEGKRYHIGNFKQPEQAARAYDHYVRQLWGQQALTNERLGFLPRSKRSSAATTGGRRAS